MNQEKVITRIANSAGEYLAPSVKVKELSCRRVMCTSGGTEDSTEESTSAWFNS